MSDWCVHHILKPQTSVTLAGRGHCQQRVDEVVAVLLPKYRSNYTGKKCSVKVTTKLVFWQLWYDVWTDVKFLLPFPAEGVGAAGTWSAAECSRGECTGTLSAGNKSFKPNVPV